MRLPLLRGGGPPNPTIRRVMGRSCPSPKRSNAVVRKRIVRKMLGGNSIPAKIELRGGSGGEMRMEGEEWVCS